MRIFCYLCAIMKFSTLFFSRLDIKAVALAAGCALYPLISSAQINAEQVMNIGRNVLSMDDYMLAIQYFNQAIKAKPYLSDPYYFRAIAKLSLDDFKGAESDCSLAIERNKFKTEAYKARGFARQCMGLDSLAVADYNVGLSYNPLDKYFLFYKAVAQTEMDKLNSADSTFSTLLRQYPRFEEGYAARARLNIARNDTTAALADLDKAISLSKSLINPYLMKAEIAWKRKDWPEAASNMDAAIRLRPEVADLYVNRAFIRYNSDDFFGAMSDYNYALELEPHNTSALFNRALLRYEVHDLSKAVADMSEVLTLDPSNFHALYNRGLISLELGKNKEALVDFKAISNRYPKFYPVYYAMAEAHRNLGDMRSAMKMAYYADDLVKQYVRNPEKHPLDKPTIAAAESQDAASKAAGTDESEIEVMEKFNRLVTVSDAVESQLSFNERIKGRVQDRNVQVEPEPLYALSISQGPVSLRSISNYFRELDDLNAQRYSKNTFYLNPGIPSAGDAEYTEYLFRIANDISLLANDGKARPVDFLTLGVVQTMLKNYPEAVASLDKAIAVDNRFTVAYMARAFARYQEIATRNLSAESEDKNTDNLLGRRALLAALQEVISDYDMALSLNPRLIFAWFNKGNIYYSQGDYTSAMQCYGEALKIDPEFGQAYFNRGLSYLSSGNKSQAFADLSKAGELGVLPSYNILKRMK